jgi:hypothetical protein
MIGSADLIFECKSCKTKSATQMPYLLAVYSTNLTSMYVYFCEKCWMQNFDMKRSDDANGIVGCAGCGKESGLANNVVLEKYSVPTQMFVVYMGFHEECFYDLCTTSFVKEYLS